jgi:hypothetical protein
VIVAATSLFPLDAHTSYYEPSSSGFSVPATCSLYLAYSRTDHMRAHTPTTEQLSFLLNNAKTPGEHLKLASY